MVNAGKKRALPSAGPSAGKKQKLANKQASSKHKGKPPGGSNSTLASKQKSADDFSSYGKRDESSRTGHKGRNKGKDVEVGGQKLLRDKKGKATIKEFVDLPQHLKNQIKQRRDTTNGQDEEGDSEDEQDASDAESLGIEDMLGSIDSNSDDDEGEDDGNGDNDIQKAGSSRQDFTQGSQFLSKLNMRELSRSRAHLLSEYRASKPETSSSKRHKELPKIAQATTKVNSDDEENLDDLDEDDFANLKDSDFDDDDDDDDDENDSLDDELSIMSDAEDLDSGLDAASGEDDATDLDDSDVDEQSNSDEGDSEDNEDSEMSAGSSHTLSDENENLEQRYAELQKKKKKREAEEAAKVKSKLPVFGAADDEESEGDAESSDDNAAEEVMLSRQSRVAHAPVMASDESDEEVDEAAEAARKQPKPNPMGARFGRPAVSGLLEISDRMERYSAAREELAVLGREVMAEPELGMNLLRRLLSFAMPVFYPNAGEKREGGIEVDAPIRSLAMLSLLAVFLDIVPGYRIRPVTDKEKSMRATQAVLQQREFEEGLVSTYRRYLETCEDEVKRNTQLAPIALRCLCVLLKEKPYFNFAVNILEVLVKTLGRRQFDNTSELCVTTLAGILREDTTGTMSLQTVRLLSRTVKARGYFIHPAALSCLLHLQFPDLGLRASTDSVDRAQKDGRQQDFNKKGKIVKGQYLNKKARKAMREKKEIEKELAEAESEIKSEEVTRNSTETLKLLFALYFRILKMPLMEGDEAKEAKAINRKKAEELLPAALEGLTRFAHLVNIDFFRDLLATLRAVSAVCEDSRTQLLCIGTAMDLLSGQGEALNMDLSELVARLYALLIPLTFDATLEQKPSSFYSSNVKKAVKSLSSASYSNQASADVLFRILSKLFLKSRTPNPQARVLAFSKRLLVACLHWPKQTSLRCLGFLRALLVRERCLEGMLSTEDRRHDGIYNYETEQESLANTEATVWWELALLEQHHFDEEVRAEANRLSRWSKED